MQIWSQCAPHAAFAERYPIKRLAPHRLRAHFAPHNRRLYEYLGRDFGWDDQPTRTAAAHT